MFGVTTSASFSRSAFIAATASSSQQAVPPLATITGSTTSCGRSRPADRRRHRLDDRGGGEHPGLDGVEAEVARDRFDLRDDEIGRHGLPGGDAERVLRGDGRDGAEVP